MDYQVHHLHRISQLAMLHIIVNDIVAQLFLQQVWSFQQIVRPDNYHESIFGKTRADGETSEPFEVFESGRAHLSMSLICFVLFSLKCGITPLLNKINVKIQNI